MRAVVFDGIQAITSDINELEEGDGSASDRQADLLLLRDELSVALRRLKEEAARLEVLFIQHIDRNGDIEVGEGQRLYVGNTRVTKSIDDKRVFLLVMEASGGDINAFQGGAEGVLVSQPWKSGAVRKLIGEDLFESAFFSETVKDLKTGSSKRSVKTFDETFSARRSSTN